LAAAVVAAAAAAAAAAVVVVVVVVMASEHGLMLPSVLSTTGIILKKPRARLKVLCRSLILN
jgi:hypothetical protein